MGKLINPVDGQSLGPGSWSQAMFTKTVRKQSFLLSYSVATTVSSPLWQDGLSKHLVFIPFSNNNVSRQSKYQPYLGGEAELGLSIHKGSRTGNTMELCENLHPLTPHILVLNTVTRKNKQTTLNHSCLQKVATCSPLLPRENPYCISVIKLKYGTRTGLKIKFGVG